MIWGEKSYNSIDYYLKKEFGEKIFKVSLDGGFTCPNRDGKISKEGCIFCSESGSGEFAGNRKKTITEQIDNQIVFLGKGADKKYIAYFQNFTGTYGDVQYLRDIYYEALSHKNIVGLAIATRGDCLDDRVIELLSELNEKTHLWIEIGLQSSNNRSAELINRGYDTEVFSERIEKLHKRNIKVVCHVILGIPFESREETMETITYLNSKGIWGIKLHLLYILKNTRLSKLYEETKFKLYNKEEYIEVVGEIIGKLDKRIIIHRLTGDAPWKDLEEPKWSTDKRGILNGISRFLKENHIYQGKYKE